MPGLSGIEVLSRAKEIAPNARRFLLSGSLYALRGEDIERLQPIHLIAKPFDGTTLREAVLSAGTESSAVA